MRIQVKLFAILKDLAGASDIALELPDGATIMDAAKQLSERFPKLAPYLKRVAFAANQSYTDKTTILHDGDELALIPPVSGG
jgi:molybdopterin converting factor subunit 1